MQRRRFSVAREVYDSYGGRLMQRVESLILRREEHARTVGVPAPWEDDLVRAIADATLDGIEVDLEIVEPAPRVRDLFAFEERCAIELEAFRRMQRGDAELRVMWDDINALATFDIHNGPVARFVAKILAEGIVKEDTGARLLRRRGQREHVGPAA